MTQAVRLLVVALVAGTLSLSAQSPAGAATQPVPPTPAGLTASIEALQPYVGQSVCDPVAKPGVAAFRDLLLKTYPGSSSLGIVRDCGAGGQSEHKEGRAFDWGMNAANATQAAQVNALLSWLLKTDQFGNPQAMLRRFGIMYVIWNKQMFRAYAPEKGWTAYTGDSEHTDHVHFSFGWSGANKVTSYWDGTVAGTQTSANAVPSALTPVPFRSPDNLAVLRTFGALTLKTGSTGPAVVALQKVLGLDADGSFGSKTAAAVNAFTTSVKLPSDGTFGPDAWSALFLPPITPFGALALARVPGGIDVTGWDIDADTTDPVRTTVLLDGTQVAALYADVSRPDVAAVYPGSGAAHGYRLLAATTAGTHTVCSYAVNAPGTPGTNVRLGCATLVVTDQPTGTFDAVKTTFGTTTLSGWALDPDSDAPLGIQLTSDGKALLKVTASAARPAVAPWNGYGAARGFAETTSLPDGTHALCATALNVPGTPGGNTSLGCQSITVRRSPTGSFDSLVLLPGGQAQVSGYAYDPDSTSTVPVTVTWDGKADPATPADLTRTDAGAKFPGYGSDHGFRLTKTLADGTHTACITATNAPGTVGANASIGCRTLTVTHSGVGAFESLRTTPSPSSVTFSGWALDPDTAGPSKVAVTVDGRYLQVLTAGVARADLPAVWKAWGTLHGYASTVTLASGSHRLCTFLLNAAGPGARVAQGCRTVLVGTPTGGLDFASPSPGRLNVRGWVFDPDTTKPATVTLVLDGHTVAALTASAPRADVAAHYPGYGAAHGYQTTVKTAPGAHTLCVYARNVAGTPGANVKLGCKTARTT
jgi:peptidoglycan hydrolase-like protein with peptidoglycan-binding domain